MMVFAGGVMAGRDATQATKDQDTTTVAKVVAQRALWRAARTLASTTPSLEGCPEEGSRGADGAGRAPVGAEGPWWSAAPFEQGG
jgi:hypothetical protein